MPKGDDNQFFDGFLALLVVKLRRSLQNEPQPVGWGKAGEVIFENYMRISVRVFLEIKVSQHFCR